MAINDFTDYLGRTVSFLVPFSPLEWLQGQDVYQLVTGTIDEVCINLHQDNSSFFCHDENYAFSDVIFLNHILPVDRVIKKPWE